MTNFPFTDESQLRDIESINLLSQAKAEGRESWAWNGILHKGRDNARTPMQWEDAPHAGFTTGMPWIAVNPNYHRINVRRAQADPDSILNFYRALLALRQRTPALCEGTLRLLLPEHPQLLVYERACEDAHVVVCCNFSDKAATLPTDFTGQMLLCSRCTGNILAPYGYLVLSV